MMQQPGPTDTLSSSVTQSPFRGLSVCGRVCMGGDVHGMYNEGREYMGRGVTSNSDMH